jgi:hypothetical protein
MRSWTRIVGGAVVVGAVFVAAGAVGWAQQPSPRPKLEPVAVPTPAVSVPPPMGALPLHLARPQIPKPAPPRTVGALAIPTLPAGGFGIVSSGTGGGGRFFDADGGAEAWLGSSNYGIQAYGNTGGGYFEDSNSSSLALVGSGYRGIEAWGNEMGGLFGDSDSSGFAYVGFGDHGIEAYGFEMGGSFADTDQTGLAWVGVGDYGILAWGNMGGGYFGDADHSGNAYVGYGDLGISASGNTAGSYFKDANSSGYAYVGYGDRGIEAHGNEMGGYFKDDDSSGYAYVGYGNSGIQGYGTYGVQGHGTITGGYFEDDDSSARAYVAYNDDGIYALGNDRGGYFADADSSGYANVGYAGYGITAYGNSSGGGFYDRDSSGYALVAYSTYKIYGSGSVNFVQNHPFDPAAVIVYAAPEGDEVATYTRGTARLVGGEAHVPLGDTFKWVTNPDLGLTAHLTPHGEPVPLAVVSVSTEELVVRGPKDAPDGLVFDYLVYGLRIGFEETTVVQEKTQESFIPSMKDHRELVARRPDLARHTALARYSAAREALGATEPLKLERASALKAAIHEFDPAVDTIEKAGPPHEQLPSAPSGQAADPEGSAAVPSAPIRQQGPGEPSGSGAPGGVVPISSDQDLHARSFSSPREQLATRVAVSGSVEPGDVLVVDREHPETFMRGERSADPTVVGVVVGEAGVALGVRPSEGGSAPVALSGIARCKADASFGAIAPGDLLVSAPTPGHAMRDASPLPGTVVGKALESLASGQGVIRILVMLR